MKIAIMHPHVATGWGLPGIRGGCSMVSPGERYGFSSMSAIVPPPVADLAAWLREAGFVLASNEGCLAGEFAVARLRPDELASKRVV